MPVTVFPHSSKDHNSNIYQEFLIIGHFHSKIIVLLRNEESELECIETVPPCEETTCYQVLLIF